MNYFGQTTAACVQEHKAGLCGAEAALADGGHGLRCAGLLHCVPSPLLQTQEPEPARGSSLAAWSWRCRNLMPRYMKNVHKLQQLCCTDNKCIPPTILSVLSTGTVILSDLAIYLRGEARADPVIVQNQRQGGILETAVSCSQNIQDPVLYCSWTPELSQATLN